MALDPETVRRLKSEGGKRGNATRWANHVPAEIDLRKVPADQRRIIVELVRTARRALDEAS